MQWLQKKVSTILAKIKARNGMKIIYLGDVVGKSGRTAVMKHLPMLREKYNFDFLILNGENAAHGFGITPRICEEFFEAGINVITLGNHAWDKREILNYIQKENRLIRPLNYPENTPGKGSELYKTRSGDKIFVAQVMGCLFMKPLENPFNEVEKCLSKITLGVDVNCIILDIHAEATSEKMAMGQYLDGRVSMVIGSHSHIPTADTQILPGGTAYQTDAGMCGDYDSVIGMKKEPSVNRFVQELDNQRLEPAEGEATVCGVLLETDDISGLAVRVHAIRVGGRLTATKTA